MVTSVGRMGVMLDFFCVWFIFVWFPIWDLIIQTQCREKRTLRSSGFSNNTKLNVSINCNVIVEFGTFYFEMREIPITSFSQKLNIWFFFGTWNSAHYFNRILMGFDLDFSLPSQPIYHFLSIFSLQFEFLAGFDRNRNTKRFIIHIDILIFISGDRSIAHQLKHNRSVEREREPEQLTGQRIRLGFISHSGSNFVPKTMIFRKKNNAELYRPLSIA